MDAIFNEKNEQICDQTPIELPLGYHHPEDLSTIIARMVANAQLVQSQNDAGIDTEEEANDFDVMDEEITVPSGHEYTEMQEEYVNKLRPKTNEIVDKTGEETTAVTEPKPSAPGKKPKTKAVKSVEESSGDEQ